MPTYETLFITPPNLGEDEENVTVETLAQVVTEGGGSMIANDRMGRRRLGYPIRKFDDGVYVRFLYDSESDVPKELERRIRLSDRVLRSMTVRLGMEWAVAAKEEAVREAQRRADAEIEAARLAAEEAAKPKVEPATLEVEPAAIAAAAPDEDAQDEDTDDES